MNYRTQNTIRDEVYKGDEVAMKADLDFMPKAPEARGPIPERLIEIQIGLDNSFKYLAKLREVLVPISEPLKPTPTSDDSTADTSEYVSPIEKTLLSINEQVSMLNDLIQLQLNRIRL